MDIRDKGCSLGVFPDNCCVIDIETTGLNSKADAIIELGAIRVRDRKITETFSTLIRPPFDIPSEISQLTGISDEMVENAPELEDVLDDFLAFTGDDILVAHNANFDINFIYDNVTTITGDSFNNDFVDTLRIARKVLPALRHHRLSDLTRYYGIERNTAHRALADCEQTYELLYALERDAYDLFGSMDCFRENY